MKRTLLMMVLMAMFNGAEAENQQWSETMTETYPMGGGLSLDEAIIEIRSRMKRKAVQKAGEYIAGRETLSDHQIEYELDRVQGGTVRIDILDKTVVMREGEPVARVKAEVSVDERDVTRFLERTHGDEQSSPSVSMEVVDRTDSIPVGTGLRDELLDIAHAADWVGEQLRINFISRLFVEPQPSVDPEKARFRVRVLWQTAAPNLFDLAYLKGGLPPQDPTLRYDESNHSASVSDRMLTGWGRTHRFTFLNASSGQALSDTRLMRFDPQRSVFSVPNWEHMRLTIDKMELQTEQSLLKQATFLYLAMEQLDVVVRVGGKVVKRHSLVRAVCNEDRDDRLQQEDLKLRNKEEFNQWVEDCDPQIVVRFVPDVELGNWYVPSRRRWMDRDEGTPGTGAGLNLDQWNERLESPYGPDFPDLGWEFVVELDGERDPSAVTVSVERHREL